MLSKTEGLLNVKQIFEKTLLHGSEMGRRVCEHRWEQTEFGPLENWPQSLVTAVNIVLTSKFPMILFWGKKLTVIYNDGYIPIFGARHPQVLGKTGFEAWGEVWDVLYPMFEKVFQGEATWSINQLLPLTRNGYTEECYFTWSYSPLRNELGEVAGVLTPITETTSQVLSERRLSSLRELGNKSLMATNTEQACKIVIDILARQSRDCAFTILYLCDNVQQPLRLINTSGFEHLPLFFPTEINLSQSTDNKLTILLQQSLLEKKMIDIPTPAKDYGILPGGFWPEPSQVAVALPINASEQEGVLGILIIGISPRRALDNDYRIFLELVAGQIARVLVAAKTYEDERNRAEKLAEIDRAKTNFFNNVSHEFRTPLTLMLSPLQDILSDQNLSMQHRQDLILVQRNAERLLKLVNSLLDFSRIEANRIQAVYEPTDVAKLTIDLTKVFHSIIEKAELEFIMDISPLDEPVYLDKEMWEKILFNLLSNAFKFTLKGFIKVSLHKQENFVVLSVQDTGSGIPEAELPRMFERFHRIENSKGRSFEGSGIGLALIKELVTLQGGKVRVESKADCGSTFFISLPLGTAHLSPEQLGARESYQQGKIGNAYAQEALQWTLPKETSNPLLPQPTPEDFTTASPKARILLADDNHDMRQYIYNLLSPYWLVEVVTDGEAALAAAQKHKPDLILTDVMMPKMDGFGLLRALRSQDALKAIPVIMLSARAGEEAKVEGLRAGADDYLVKPFSGKELLARINTHLALGLLHVKLEERVQQRTQELEQSHQKLRAEMHERLQLKQKLQVEAIRAKTAEEYREKQKDFIDTVCHEIRNPLNGMFGCVDGIRSVITQMEAFLISYEKSLSWEVGKATVERLNELKEVLNNLEICVDQQKVIVDDVLDLSKLENNKIILNSEPFNPKEPILAALQMFKQKLSQKKLSVRLELSDEFYIDADSKRFMQIVINLISNAIKFTSKGSITIVLTKKMLSHDQLEVEVHVKDTGIGMTKQESARLFQPFSQANEKVTTEFGGTGLGLVISKKLVAMMGGEIAVTSKKNRGSDFYFTIVAPISQKPALTTAEKQRATSPDSLMKAQPKRVLIVDDNTINQKILTKLVKDHGHTCMIANNGLEALQLYQMQDFDIVLMDIEMPVMNGLEATRQIRLDEKNQDKSAITIIGLSGNARNEQIEMALETGMNGYLTKPYHKETLLKYINQSENCSALATSSKGTIISKQFGLNPSMMFTTSSQSSLVKIDLAIVGKFMTDAKLLLQQNLPFLAICENSKIIISLPDNQYLRKSILKDLKRNLELGLTTFDIEQEYKIENEKLIIRTGDAAQARLVRQFLTEVGLGYAFTVQSSLRSNSLS